MSESNPSLPEQNLEPLRSVHTSNFPEILEHFGISILVTTYQAGRVVILRAVDGGLNTHFRGFDKPMGLALAGNRLAIGGAHSVWEFHNLPAVSKKLDQPERTDRSNRAAPPRDDDTAKRNVASRHDACFLPRLTHWTGDIQIHEMVWSGEGADAELWFVNTLFSCLCRRSDIYNFEPVWRPSFIDRYIPGDCCHLNGLGRRDGVPRYVTALGETATPGGWRENKRDGGILIDLDSGQTLVRNLSMPHSPRWYRDRVWLLESGRGSLGFLDPASGVYQEVVALPGFTRGLSFIGPLALVGLSQVRESAVFGGVPIAERALEERTCGVWVIKIDSGEVVGFVKFEDAVQEIFAVEVCHALYPELVNEDRDLLAGSFELPENTLVDVPPELRSD